MNPGPSLGSILGCRHSTLGLDEKYRKSRPFSFSTALTTLRHCIYLNLEKPQLQLHYHHTEQHSNTMNPRLEPEVFGIKALEGGAEKYKGPEGVMRLGRTTTHGMGIKM